MKKNALFLFVMVVVAAQGQDHWKNFTIDSKMKKAPYGFTWLEKGRKAVKQTEVTVDEYLGFLEEVTNDSSFDYVMNIKPGSECALYPFTDTSHVLVSVGEDDPDYRKISWLYEDRFLKANNYPPVVKNKNVDNSYINPYNMPITGISYEQALKYAEWCTRYYNREMFRKSGNKGKAVVFRLPRPEEFDSISRLGIERCNMKDPKDCERNIKALKLCKNEKGCALCNVMDKDTCASNKKIIEVFGPAALYGVYSFNPDWLGIYNMRGNAAEMTSAKGIAKGGSYLQDTKDCMPGNSLQYSKPEKWLGLRLIAEVVDVDGKTVYFDNKGNLVVKK
ncbi:MAG TPA: SUMF1/EgtB/PvdO family nonheme iron enzyme [Bacteroidia bacterium]